MIDGISEILRLEFRWVLVGALFITFSISKLYRHRARKARLHDREIHRTDENIVMILARLLTAIPLFMSVFAYMIHPEWMAWAHLDLPVWVHSVGTAMVILAVPMGYWVMSSLGDNVSETIYTRPDQKLIQHGPYRWVRHPLYTNGMMLFMGAGVGAENAFIILFTLLTWAGIYRLVIPQEEAELLERFGEDYEEYMARTGKLLPQLRSSEPEAAANGKNGF